jgi:hypothetical protein
MHQASSKELELPRSICTPKFTGEFPNNIWIPGSGESILELTGTLYPTILLSPNENLIAFYQQLM